MTSPGSAVISVSPKLPPVFCPIPPAINPCAAAVHDQAVRWLGRQGLGRTGRDRATVLDSRGAAWVSRLVPHARQDRVLLMAQWVYWGFLFDDHQCDTEPYGSDLARFVELVSRLTESLVRPGDAGPDDPFASALRSLLSDLGTPATPAQRRRWVDGHRHWLDAVAWQNSYSQRGTVAPLDDFLVFRRATTGLPVVMAMFDFADGDELTDTMLQDPGVLALTEMARLIIGLDNDLQSYGKETCLGEVGQNIFTVLAVHTGATAPGETIGAAVLLRDQVMVAFLSLSRRVAAEAADPALRRYVDNLGHAVRGNLDWGLAVPRYLKAPGWRDRTQAITTTLPTPVTPAGLSELPSIAWWWDQLAAHPAAPRETGPTAWCRQSGRGRTQ
ncbi:terpene synthase family protein [Streptomyces sp. HUAS TT7]|uniref:terpene synthase family protein n=1 Tax=Streptomyces sp. HUAS TT7 TaxID=3447507 RepID=UPI003F65551D